MCMFSAPSMPKDNSAAIARQKQQAREASIREGRTSIDGTFAKFDDNYFNKVGDNYSNYYLPQLEDQYRKARRTTVLGSARRGQLNTSAGARRIADITGLYQKNRTMIGDRAAGAIQSARSDVENARNDLYSQNRASADPSGAASSAMARANSLSTPAQFNPMGDIFANAINTAAQGVALERFGYRGLNTGLFNNTNARYGSGSRGSAKYVKDI